MRKIFNTAFTVTQPFGVNKAYYSQFGLAGHEGIDLIPTGSDWSVLALEDGQVVRDIDMASAGGAYGNTVTIWHPSIKKATMYCHFSSNTVTIDQQVKKGDKIGVMGSSGNTQGAHTHLNLFNVDDNGVRLNKDNGYLGGIDPLPFLKEGGVTEMNEIDQVRKDRDRNYNLYDGLLVAICNALGIPIPNDKLTFDKQIVVNKINELKNKPTGTTNPKAEALLKAVKDAVS